MSRYTPKPIKFGFFTDSHFSVIRQDFRTDSFFESVLSKMNQSYKHFEEEGCDFVLFGGDFFDKPSSVSREMIKKIRDVLMSYNLTTYFIWGQHDLAGYNRETAKNSNLFFLKNICDGKLVEVKDYIDIGPIYVFASHVDQNYEERLKEISNSLQKPVVVLVHALLSTKKTPFGEIDIHTLPKTRADLVLSGDLHSGYMETESKGTIYYNPGSLARTSKENRKPKSCIIEITPFMDSWSIQIKDFYPVCDDYPFPEEKKDISVSKEQNSNTYLEAFNKFRSESKDIFERLEKVGIEHNIDKSILNYILSKRK